VNTIKIKFVPRSLIEIVVIIGMKVLMKENVVDTNILEGHIILVEHNVQMG
jgi:hypothetical protein